MDGTTDEATEGPSKRGVESRSTRLKKEEGAIVEGQGTGKERKGQLWEGSCGRERNGKREEGQLWKSKEQK